MKCFIIMPYDPRFDDVHHWIRQSVSMAVSGMTIEAFRLDEDQRAGRIVGRLERELAAADFCVADVTGRRPNVMWEIGYAMALGKHPILVADAEQELPFDLHDMHRIIYDRLSLQRTLAEPLAKSVRDTVAAIGHGPLRRTAGVTDPAAIDLRNAESISRLETQVVELRDMMQGLVQRYGPEPIGSHKTAKRFAELAPASLLASLAGAWINTETGSHAYTRGIRGRPITPYCYGGNSALTGAYYGWRDDGGWIFGRYAWRHEPISGFTYLRKRLDDELEGQWWFDTESSAAGVYSPDPASGFDSHWMRKPDLATPAWAEDFFAEVERFGLERALGRDGGR